MRTEIAVCRMDLRILATTDIHMNLLGYDYFINQRSQHHGFAAVASLIEESRNSHPNTLLFDNGDILHGTPLGDYLADTTSGQDHPVVSMMNQLGYDAATLGNHDFSFGSRFLLKAVEAARFPVISSNLITNHKTTIQRRAILQRHLIDRDGREHALRIGVLGFLPPQTTSWNCDLQSFMSVDEILDTAYKEVEQLRREGVDLVIALAHSGIAGSKPGPRMENAAIPLAAVEGIDAVIAGHIHRVFPSPDFPSNKKVDPILGAISGKPVVMPGFRASHLGVIDLSLQQDDPDAGWQVESFGCEARPAREDTPPHPAVIASVVTAHQATLRYYARQIARTAAPLSSFFSLLGRDAGLNLVNTAQISHMRRALACSEWAELPLLSVTSPFRTGGRGGPLNYTNIEPGQLSLRDIAALYPFPNRICAAILTGSEIADWLERAASIYSQISPEGRDQELIDPKFPSYNFDVIRGVEWSIDLSNPPRYDPLGEALPGDARRIQSLSHQGRPVRPDDSFVLATNSYRLSDCGLFSPLLSSARIVLKNGPRIRDILDEFISDAGRIAPDADLGFRFLPIPNATVLFETSPAARSYLTDLAKLRPETLGETADGFLQLRLSP